MITEKKYYIMFWWNIIFIYNIIWENINPKLMSLRKNINILQEKNNKSFEEKIINCLKKK